jgi:hypothetical protein
MRKNKQLDNCRVCVVTEDDPGSNKARSKESTPRNRYRPGLLEYGNSREQGKNVDGIGWTEYQEARSRLNFLCPFI